MISVRSDSWDTTSNHDDDEKYAKNLEFESEHILRTQELMTHDKSSDSLKITDEHWLTFTIALSLSRGTKEEPKQLPWKVKTSKVLSVLKRWTPPTSKLPSLTVMQRMKECFTTKRIAVNFNVLYKLECCCFLTLQVLQLYFLPIIWYGLAKKCLSGWNGYDNYQDFCWLLAHT